MEKQKGPRLAFALAAGSAFAGEFDALGLIEPRVRRRRTRGFSSLKRYGERTVLFFRAPRANLTPKTSVTPSITFYAERLS